MKKFRLGKTLLGMAGAAMITAAATSANADTFTLKIGSGQPMKPLEPIFMAHNYFVPTVSKRVEAETDHKIRFIENYNTVTGPFDTFEAIQSGLFDIGLWCACFEPTKAVHFVFQFFVPFVTDDPMKQLEITRQAYKEFPAWTNSLAKYNQIYLGIGSFAPYGMGTNFKWEKVSDLKGHKIAGAGPNLPWLKLSGATPVQTSLNEAYNALQSGVYEGLVIFPTAWRGFKLYEPAPVFTLVGWGAIPTYNMSMNKETFEKLPKDIQKIIMEESDNWEVKTAEEAARRGKASLDFLAKEGRTVQVLPQEERAKLAKALGDWPNEKAKEFDKKGLPGTAFFKRYLEIAKEKGAPPAYPYEIK